jgi:sugar phosphate isomerase/epimerase
MDERISVNALCFPGADWSAMTEIWRELGARRISFPSGVLPDDHAAVVEEIKHAGQTVESITHPFLTGAFLDATDDVVADAARRLSQLVSAASRVGARSIYLVTGGRGTSSWDEAAKRFCEAVAPCVDHARQAGVLLLVEPVASLYADLHLATSLRDATKLAEMAGMGICLDIFASWTEADLGAHIERHADDIHLVQVADYVFGDRQVPSRAVPGDGDIPLDRIFGTLLAAGYAGAFDLELLGPRIDTEGHLAATRRAATRVSELLAEASS